MCQWAVAVPVAECFMQVVGQQMTTPSFVRLRGLAYKAAGNGSSSGGGNRRISGSRVAVIDRLSLMMPGKTRQQLQEHELWYTAACIHQRRTADLAEAWQRQRSSFMADSACMLQEASVSAAAAADAAAAWLAWEASQLTLLNRLKELQLGKSQQQQVTLSC
eukprot:GHRR01010922.1.p1 GENE.GHRR01010922.1~~GHRR01010922.1.p1  ORF type:complete len:162 (+),score=83.32 GHRR01010922.1:71-556(+)